MRRHPYLEMNMRRICFAVVICFSLAGGVSLADDMASADLQPGLVMFRGKQYGEAEQFFQNFAKKNPKNAEGAFCLGRSYFHSRQVKKAVTALEKAVELDGKKAEYHYVLGLAYAAYVNEVGLFSKLGVAKKIEKAWNTALEIQPDHRDSMVALVDFYTQAPGIAGGSLGMAEETMAKLQQQYPDTVFYSKGLIAEKYKQFDKANKAFHDAVMADRTPRSVLSLARYLYRNKKYDEAIRCLHEYLALDLSWMDPIKGFAYYILGDIFAQKKMHAQAKEAFQLAHADNKDKFLGEMIEKRIQELN